MRRLALALALPLALIASRAARAEKIAYVDIARVIQEVDEGKAAKARLKSELDAKRVELQKKESELKTMSEEYTKQQGVMNDEAKQAKQGELQKKYSELQVMQRQMQEELGSKEDASLREISEKLMAVVQEVSEKDGFTFVLKKDALLNAPPAADITNEVVRRYNDRFSGGKKAAPKKQAKAPKAAKNSEEE